MNKEHFMYTALFAVGDKPPLSSMNDEVVQILQRFAVGGKTRSAP